MSLGDGIISISIFTTKVLFMRSTFCWTPHEYPTCSFISKNLVPFSFYEASQPLELNVTFVASIEV